MSFSYSALQSTTVTISGAVTTSAAIPQPNALQTVVHNYTQSTTDAYTVPAGKTFYLMGVIGAAAAAATVHIYENDGATNVLYFKIVAGTSETVSSTSPMAIYTENQIVKRINDATIISLWGYLV